MDIPQDMSDGELDEYCMNLIRNPEFLAECAEHERRKRGIHYVAPPAPPAPPAPVKSDDEENEKDEEDEKSEKNEEKSDDDDEKVVESGLKTPPARGNHFSYATSSAQVLNNSSGSGRKRVFKTMHERGTGRKRPLYNGSSTSSDEEEEEMHASSSKNRTKQAPKRKTRKASQIKRKKNNHAN